MYIATTESKQRSLLESRLRIEAAEIKRKAELLKKNRSDTTKEDSQNAKEEVSTASFGTQDIDVVIADSLTNVFSFIEKNVATATTAFQNAEKNVASAVSDFQNASDAPTIDSVSKEEAVAKAPVTALENMDAAATAEIEFKAKADAIIADKKAQEEEAKLKLKEIEKEKEARQAAQEEEAKLKSKEIEKEKEARQAAQEKALAEATAAAEAAAIAAAREIADKEAAQIAKRKELDTLAAERELQKAADAEKKKKIEKQTDSVDTPKSIAEIDPILHDEVEDALRVAEAALLDKSDAEKDIVDDAQATKDFKSEKPDSGASDAIGGVFASILETAKSIAPKNEAKSGSMEKSMPPPIPDPVPEVKKPVPVPEVKKPEPFSFFGKAGAKPEPTPAPEPPPAPTPPIVKKPEPFSFFGKPDPKPAPVPPPAPAPAPTPTAKKPEPFSFFGKPDPKPVPLPPPAPAPTPVAKKPEPFSFFGKSNTASNPVARPAVKRTPPKPAERNTFGILNKKANPVVNKPKPPARKAPPVPKKTSKPKPPVNDGIPILSNWKQESDGSITGNISNSKMFSTGQKITTSPVKKGVRKGTVVTTRSGSKYRLQ